MLVVFSITGPQTTTHPWLQARLLANPLPVQSVNAGSVLSKLSSSLTQVSVWLPQKIGVTVRAGVCSWQATDTL